MSFAQDYTGSWVRKLGERNFMVFTIKPTSEGFAGTISRPFLYQSDDGVSFWKITPEILELPILNASVENGQLHMEAEGEAYDMVLTGADSASVKPTGYVINAWTFQRSTGSAPPSVATDWDPQTTYSSRKQVLISNAEMRKIFDEDKRVGQDVSKLTAADWNVLGKQDEERRKQTQTLLTRGELHTGEDFYRAAFLFQHGSTPDDYLLAHTLAMVSVSKGYSNATWIGAATLDRYLGSIGKPQIFGTQFRTMPGTATTQEPYNRDLISDALRRELEVPTLAAQQEQLKQYQKN